MATEHTKAELLEIAKAEGVAVPSSATKAEIEVLIAKARDEQPPLGEPMEASEPVPFEAEADGGAASEADEMQAKLDAAVDLRRFAAMDAAEQAGLVVGEGWSVEDIEAGVAALTAAVNTAPPIVRDEYDEEFPNGGASPIG
jgi:hypothetical protein